MRRAPIAAVVTVSLMSGCTTMRGAGIMAGVGVGVAVAPVVGLAIAGPGSGPGQAGNVVLLQTGLLLGGAIAVGSLINLLVLATRPLPGHPALAAPHDDRDAEAEGRGAAEDGLRRQSLLSLTQTAASAARQGDCATVKDLDAWVQRADSHFHDTVFVGDAAIAACLAQPAVPTPATP